VKTSRTIGCTGGRDEVLASGKITGAAPVIRDVGQVLPLPTAQAIPLVGVFARFQSITTTFPLSHANSIIVRNPLHAFPSNPPTGHMQKEKMR